MDDAQIKDARRRYAGNLREGECRVLELRYADATGQITPVRQQTLRAIGGVLGITGVRVRQLEQAALRRLRRLHMRQARGAALTELQAADLARYECLIAADSLLTMLMALDTN